jgi:hypothetical protein
VKHPSLFPASELVSDATRQVWRHHIAFLWVAENTQKARKAAVRV